MRKEMIGLSAAGMLLSLLPMQASAASTYTVRSGDTLWGISQKTDRSVKQLMSDNGLTTTILRIGQVLKLAGSTSSPPPEAADKFHTVRSGDTLWGISRQYHMSVAKIQELNGLSSTMLKIGQKLKVAGSSSPTPKPKPTPEITSYTVKSGDTLWKVSRQYDVSVDDLKKWNSMTSNVLRIGQELVVKHSAGDPNPTTPPKPTVKEAVVQATSLYVRSSPEGSPVGMLPNGARVTLGETKGDWVKITYGNLTGWSHRDYLEEVTTPAASNGKVVILDPGHGGVDPGAVNGRDYEKTYTLLYANKLKKELEHKGYRVYLTRTSDTSCYVPYDLTPDLKCRVQKGSSFKGDVQVSIHFNSIGIPGIHRTETYYHSERSRELAESIHRKYQPAFGSGDGGIHNDRNYYVNRMATMPAVLLEVGYMSNWSDLSKIKDASVQNRVTKAIAEGIHDYFN
jgi:N-acetylmuramoyl-L-alanine amidase